MGGGRREDNAQARVHAATRCDGAASANQLQRARSIFDLWSLSLPSQLTSHRRVGRDSCIDYADIARIGPRAVAEWGAPGGGSAGVDAADRRGRGMHHRFFALVCVRVCVVGSLCFLGGIVCLSLNRMAPGLDPGLIISPVFSPSSFRGTLFCKKIATDRSPPKKLGINPRSSQKYNNHNSRRYQQANTDSGQKSL